MKHLILTLALVAASWWDIPQVSGTTGAHAVSDDSRGRLFEGEGEPQVDRDPAASGRQ